MTASMVLVDPTVVGGSSANSIVFLGDHCYSVNPSTAHHHRPPSRQFDEQFDEEAKMNNFVDYSADNDISLASIKFLASPTKNSLLVNGLIDYDIDFHHHVTTSPSSSSSSFSSPSHTLADHSAYASKASSTVSDTDYASGVESISAGEGVTASMLIMRAESSDATSVVGQSGPDEVTVINGKTISASDPLLQKFKFSMPTPPISPSRESCDLDEIVPLLEMDDGFNACIADYLKDSVDVDVESSFDDFLTLTNDSKDHHDHSPTSGFLTSSSSEVFDAEFDALLIDGIKQEAIAGMKCEVEAIASSSSSSPSDIASDACSSSTDLESDGLTLQSKLISDCMWSGPNQNLLVTERLHLASSAAASSFSFATPSDPSTIVSTTNCSPSKTETNCLGKSQQLTLKVQRQRQRQLSLLEQPQQQRQTEVCVNCLQRGNVTCQRDAFCVRLNVNSSSSSSSVSSCSDPLSPFSSSSSVFSPDVFFTSTTSSSSSSSVSQCHCSASDYLSPLDCADPTCNTINNVFPYPLSASFASSSSAAASINSELSQQSFDNSSSITAADLSTTLSVHSTTLLSNLPGLATPSESEEELESISFKEEVVVTAPASPSSSISSSSIFSSSQSPNLSTSSSAVATTTINDVSDVVSQFLNNDADFINNSIIKTEPTANSAPQRLTTFTIISGGGVNGSNAINAKVTTSSPKSFLKTNSLQKTNTKVVQRSIAPTISSSPSSSSATPARSIIIKGRPFKQNLNQHKQQLLQRQQLNFKAGKAISLLADTEGLTELQKKNIQAAASQLMNMKINRKRFLETDDRFESNNNDDYNNNNSHKNNNGGAGALSATSDHEGICKRARLSLGGSSSSSSSSSVTSPSTKTSSSGIKRHTVTSSELTEALMKVTSSQKSRRSAGGGGGGRGFPGNGFEDVLLDDRLDPIKRAQHNVLERKRRTDLKMSFQALRVEVPELHENDKAPKVLILKRAAEHIYTKRDEEERLSEEKDSLQQRNDELKARLMRLKQQHQRQRQQQRLVQQQTQQQQTQQQQLQHSDLKLANFRTW